MKEKTKQMTSLIGTAITGWWISKFWPYLPCTKLFWIYTPHGQVFGFLLAVLCW